MSHFQADLRVKPETLLRSARSLARVNLLRGFLALNELFRAGTVPDPLPNGRYSGEMIAIDIAPGLTQFFGWLAERWMPWQGKRFEAAQQRGENIFTKDSYQLARLFNPFYRGFASDGAGTYRGFAFQTHIAPGLFDGDRTVLKIDYDLRENPAFTVRRVLDELVQLG